MLLRVWTKEQREAQRERIKASKPWEKSTGPRTREGRQKSCLNAFKHGKRAKRFVSLGNGQLLDFDYWKSDSWLDMERLFRKAGFR